jgi:hypothetical protein
MRRKNQKGNPVKHRNPKPMHRKNILNTALFISFVFALFIPNALAAPTLDAIYFPKRYTIGTESLETNGVLICRPAPADIKILEILRRNNISSLKEYASWLQKTLAYKSDPSTEDWIPWEKTLDRGYCDCKGFALLNYSFLNVMGYKPKILAFLGWFSGHSICVCEEDGYYIWLDNAELKITPARSMREFAEYLFKEYECDHLFEIQKNSWERIVLFTKKTLCAKTQ